jgi:hypothetical protein
VHPFSVSGEDEPMRSNAKILLLVAVTFLFTLVGHAQSVVVDWDHNISNFSDFKT